jgi:hypothetical protein
LQHRKRPVAPDQGSCGVSSSNTVGENIGGAK